MSCGKVSGHLDWRKCKKPQRSCLLLRQVGMGIFLSPPPLSSLLSSLRGGRSPCSACTRCLLALMDGRWVCAVPSSWRPACLSGREMPCYGAWEGSIGDSSCLENESPIIITWCACAGVCKREAEGTNILITPPITNPTRPITEAEGLSLLSRGRCVCKGRQSVWGACVCHTGTGSSRELSSVGRSWHRQVFQAKEGKRL